MISLKSTTHFNSCVRFLCRTLSALSCLCRRTIFYCKWEFLCTLAQPIILSVYGVVTLSAVRSEMTFTRVHLLVTCAVLFSMLHQQLSTKSAEIPASVGHRYWSEWNSTSEWGRLSKFSQANKTGWVISNKRINLSVSVSLSLSLVCRVQEILTWLNSCQPAKWVLSIFKRQNCSVCV